MTDTNSNLVLVRSFEAVKPSTLAKLSTFARMPMANLVKTLKVSGYRLQPLKIGDSKIEIAVIDQTVNSKTDDGDKFQTVTPVNQIVVFTRTEATKNAPEKWATDSDLFDFDSGSAVVRKVLELVTKLPVGILVSRGLIDQSVAVPVLALAVQSAYSLSADHYDACVQFAEYYFQFCNLYPSYAAIAPSSVTKHIGHSQLKALSGSDDSNTTVTF